MQQTFLIIEDREAWGFVPHFLNANDPRPAWEQIDDNYIMGWHPQDGFEITRDDGGVTLSYKGDPDMRSFARLWFRDETLYLCPHAYVVLTGKDGKLEACRLD